MCLSCVTPGLGAVNPDTWRCIWGEHVAFLFVQVLCDFCDRNEEPKVGLGVKKTEQSPCFGG